MPLLNESDYAEVRSHGATVRTINVSPSDVRSTLTTLGERMLVTDEVLSQICAALNSGSHLILSGPPGTGKTTLAKAVSIAAMHQDPIITTATADWTTFDTVGGYMPDIAHAHPNALVFEKGVILESMVNRTWLVIDEINRAQIDKAIGAVFSVLSDGDVILPYRVGADRVRIASDDKPSTDATIYKTSDWRLIATMNDYDKTSLFDMSYAFMRRFAVIRIGVPENYASLITGWCTGTAIDPVIITNMHQVAEASENGQIREIGPVVFKNVIRYLVSRIHFDSDYTQHYLEALSFYLLPQFQGAEEHSIANLWDIIRRVVTDTRQSTYFGEQLDSMTSVDLRRVEQLLERRSTIRSAGE